MPQQKTFIIDFDSTFINCETLDTLASIIYQDSEELPKISAMIANATNACMAGEVGIHESLVSRVKILKIQKQHVLAAVDLLRQQITTSFVRNRAFIEDNAKDIFIFSGGFSEIIIPIVAEFHIPSSNVYANRFIYSDNKIIGIDESCLLAHNNGKAKQLENLQRADNVYVIGDGVTDAEIKNAHAHVTFYLFTENVFRKNLVNRADKVIGSLDEFISDLKLL